MIEDSVPQEFDVDAKVNVGNEFKYDNDDKKPKPRGGGSAAGGVELSISIFMRIPRTMQNSRKRQPDSSE